MKPKLNSLLLAGSGVLTVSLFTLAFVFQKRPPTDSSFGALGQESTGRNPARANQPDRFPSEQSPVSLQQALQSAQGATDPARRGELLKQWADSVDLDRMADMLEQTASISKGDSRTEARAALLSSWAERNLNGAVTWFGSRTGADDLHEQSRDLLAESMADREPTAMVAWMEQSLPATSRMELYAPCFRQWTTSDPGAAAALLSQKATSPDSTNQMWVDLLGQVAAQWANTDVNSAVRWAQTLPEGPARTLALSQVAYNWTEASPQAAAAYAAQENNPQLLQNVATKWGETDPLAAAAWVSGLPEGSTREAATAALVSSWAHKYPTGAASFAADIAPGKTQSQAVMAVLSTWADEHPTDAAQWVGQFPEGTVRAKAMEQLMNMWAASDTNQAAQWLQGLPQTPSRDTAVNAFSTTISPSSPADGFKWAETISDTNMRNQQLQSVARIWLQQDPSAAQVGIAQSNLSPIIKSGLLRNSSR